MSEKQLCMINENLLCDEEIAEIKRQNAKKKRKWENAFQKWSDEQGQDGMSADGICGYGTICDWCVDNSYGRPCVRALNQMCRERNIRIDYDNYNFEKVW